MTIIQAMTNHLNQKITRPSWSGDYFVYYAPKTGPFQDLVDCDYFVFYEDGLEPNFSTSIDLYPEDLMAQDYQIIV